MEKDDEKIIDPVVEPAENPVIAPEEDVIPATPGEGEVIDNNTEIEPEDTSVEPVTEPEVEPAPPADIVPPMFDIPPTEDETLAPTDDIIPAPEEVPVEIPAEPEPVTEPIPEPVIDEPVVSDVVPDAGDEMPADYCPGIKGDACDPGTCVTEDPVPGECPNCEGEGCPTCEPTPCVKGDGCSIGQIFGTFQEAVTIAWGYHLKTKKYSTHIALHEFYEKALDIVDDIIEQYQGIHGIVEEPFSCCIHNNDGETEAEYLDNLRAFINNNKFTLGSESEIMSAVDEFLGLIDSTLYKIINLTENAVKSFEEFCYEDLNEYKVYNKYGDLISDDEEEEEEPEEEEPQDDNGNPGKPGPGGESTDEEEEEGEEENEEE